jgi:hypothetical protein
MARMAASLTFSGVSKSGSPADSPSTSRPWRFSSRVFWVMARVADGLTRLSAADSSNKAPILDEGGKLWSGRARVHPAHRAGG